MTAPWYRRPTTLRLLLLLTLLTCVLGYAEKAPCRDTRNWSNEFQYTHLCYSDVVALYGAEGLDQGDRPYLDAPVEYPVLIGAAMQGAAEVSRLAPATSVGGQDLGVALFGDATALLLILAAGVVVGCTALTAGARPQDALLVAVAPSLLLHAFTNWDLLAVAFASAGVLAWSRRAPALAGVLLGLGAATKFYPILFLVPLALLCLRAGRLRTWARTAGWTLGTLVLVNLPVYLAAGYFTENKVRGPGVVDVVRAGGGWGAALAPHHSSGGGVATNALLRFLDLNKTRVADWDSGAFGLQFVAASFSPNAFGPVHLIALGLVLVATLGGAWAVRRSRRALISVAAGGLVALVVVAVGLPRLLDWTREQGTLPVGGLNLVTGALLVLALIGVGVLALGAPVRPRLPQLLFLTVVAFLLTNKVFSPQYVLWVLPLAALARPRWRPFLLWQAAEALVLVTRYYYFAGSSSKDVAGLGLGWFVAAVAIRDLTLLLLAGLVIRDVLHPERDDVRAATASGEDPAGGVLVNAEDRVRLGGPGSPGSPGSLGSRRSRRARHSRGATEPAHVGA